MNWIEPHQKVIKWLHLLKWCTLQIICKSTHSRSPWSPPGPKALPRCCSLWIEMEIQICFFFGKWFYGKKWTLHKNGFVWNRQYLRRKMRIEQSFAIMCSQKLMCFFSFLSPLVKFLYSHCVAHDTERFGSKYWVPFYIPCCRVVKLLLNPEK